jgi:hypothetical protein
VTAELQDECVGDDLTKNLKISVEIYARRKGDDAATKALAPKLVASPEPAGGIKLWPATFDTKSSKSIVITIAADAGAGKQPPVFDQKKMREKMEGAVEGTEELILSADLTDLCGCRTRKQLRVVQPGLSMAANGETSDFTVVPCPTKLAAAYLFSNPARGPVELALLYEGRSALECVPGSLDTKVAAFVTVGTKRMLLAKLGGTANRADAPKSAAFVFPVRFTFPSNEVLDEIKRVAPDASEAALAVIRKTLRLTVSSAYETAICSCVDSFARHVRGSGSKLLFTSHEKRDGIKTIIKITSVSRKDAAATATFVVKYDIEAPLSCVNHGTGFASPRILLSAQVVASFKSADGTVFDAIVAEPDEITVAASPDLTGQDPLVIKGILVTGAFINKSEVDDGIKLVEKGRVATYEGDTTLRTSISLAFLDDCGVTAVENRVFSTADIRKPNAVPELTEVGGFIPNPIGLGFFPAWLSSQNALEVLTGVAMISDDSKAEPHRVSLRLVPILRFTLAGQAMQQALPRETDPGEISLKLNDRKLKGSRLVLETIRFSPAVLELYRRKVPDGASFTSAFAGHSAVVEASNGAKSGAGIFVDAK